MTEKLREIKARYDFLNDELSKNEVCSDAETFRKYSKERAEICEIAEEYEKYVAIEREMNDAFAAAEEESDKEMKDLLVAEGYECKERLADMAEQLKILLLPKDEADEKGCVLEVRAGAGGEEAALFAGVLCRMYEGYCAKKRLKMQVAEISATELGGVKEAVYQVTGKGAYKLLKYESGVHRVQRVPETETQGRIHTSTATVAVLPEAEDVDVEINDKDVRIDIFHSGGAGGQNVNKVASAVRITHFPSGLVVTCQDERSQLKNKERAFQVLRSRLFDLYRGKAGAERDGHRRSLVGSGDRSERIRTYNYPQSRITDHRIGFSVFDMEKFLSGEMDEMMEALQIADRELLLKESK